jgi:alkanesulfonate monooxygenase SsuD/methylene tetrahydromethanopterin reductase-like flavin-dependent oxidoreductase (luciferase family)
MNPERFDIFAPAVEKGLAKSGKTLSQFDVAPFVTVVLGDDVAACRMPVKGMLALYIGGMGARDKNFYNQYATQLGYGDAARTIQDLYLDGKKLEAMAAVPDALVDDIALCGPRDRIQDRAQRWIEAGKKHHVGSMLIGGGQPEALRLMAELVL